MQITIQIADAVYQQILSNGKRVKGSIGLVNASEGNNIPFNVSELLQVNTQEGREVINEKSIVNELGFLFVNEFIELNEPLVDVVNYHPDEFYARSA